MRKRERRKNNIVIKDITGGENITNEWIEKFIKDKLVVEIQVINYRSRRVIIATLQGEEQKRKVMSNKS